MRKAFATADEVFSWIGEFLNQEKGQDVRSFRLDRIELLASMFGNPQLSYRTIHVAGSKGKGSTSAMMASILDAAGFRTGLYTSPHLLSYKERITIAGREIPDEAFASAGDRLREKVERIDPAAFPGGCPPTFFELLTLLGFLMFRDLGCEWVVLEVGMGGRLDATNICLPEASVLTRIELEHVEYLGDTIAKIAGEKAGIVKRGRPVLCGRQPEEALAVFREKARAAESPFSYLPDLCTIDSAVVDRTGTRIGFTLTDRAASERFSATLRLFGRIQAENAGLAALAIRQAAPEVSSDTIVRGLEAAWLPARSEVVPGEPPVMFDGAHTPASVAFALETFSALFPGPATLIFGCALGKDVGAMARELSPRFDEVIVTTPGSFKKSDSGETLAAFTAAGKTARFFPDPEAALADAESAGRPVLVTGSFYLAAEIMRRLKCGTS
jgi:dihydrofolate synthase / folylpolyglutamate synthase